MYGRSRLSHGINRKVVQRIFDAFDYAEHMETPFNFYVVFHLNGTIHKSHSTVIEDYHRRFRGWFNRACKKHGLELRPTYAWTRENPDHNEHLNWVVHIPDLLKSEFELKLSRWVNRSQGTSNEFTVKLSPITKNYKSVANYIVKGVDIEFIEHFHLQKLVNRHGPQGETYGKRAGYSMNIGRAAVKRDRFNPKQYRRQRLRRAA